MQTLILKARAESDLPEIGVHAGDIVYLARDTETSVQATRFRVVKWHIDRWICSCGQGRCEHKFVVNEFVFAQSQAAKAGQVTGNERC